MTSTLNTAVNELIRVEQGVHALRGSTPHDNAVLSALLTLRNMLGQDEPATVNNVELPTAPAFYEQTVETEAVDGAVTTLSDFLSSRVNAWYTVEQLMTRTRLGRTDAITALAVLQQRGKVARKVEPPPASSEMFRWDLTVFVRRSIMALLSQGRKMTGTELAETLSFELADVHHAVGELAFEGKLAKNDKNEWSRLPNPNAPTGRLERVTPADGTLPRIEMLDKITALVSGLKRANSGQRVERFVKGQRAISGGTLSLEIDAATAKALLAVLELFERPQPLA